MEVCDPSPNLVMRPSQGVLAALLPAVPNRGDGVWHARQIRVIPAAQACSHL